MYYFRSKHGQPRMSTSRIPASRPGIRDHPTSPRLSAGQQVDVCLRFLLGIGSVLLVTLAGAAPLVAQEQEATITGRILDGRSLTPISQVQVSIPDSDLGTLTAANGRYLLLGVPAGEVTVRVERIGYAPVERTVTVVADESLIADFELTLRPVALDAVVVTGTAGERPRREQAAVVAVVDVAQVVAVGPISQVTDILQSRVPGVDVRAGNGNPGVAPRIRIRGESSINLSNEPLIFLDGIRVDSRQVRLAPPGTANSSCCEFGGQVASRLNDIAQEDIESIEVVKGPAAATLYGADASAGVIQIITKRGTPGAFRQTVDLEYNGVQSTYDPPANWGLCSQSDIGEGRPICSGLSPGSVVSDNPLVRENVQKTGRLFGLGWTGAGGAEQFTYYLSARGMNETGFFPNQEYGRYTGRLNLNWTPTSTLRIDAGYSLARIDNEMVDGNSSAYGMTTNAGLGNPLTLGLANNGWWSTRDSEAIDALDSTIKTTKNTVTLGATYTPLSWFTHRLSLGTDMSNSKNRRVIPKNDNGWFPGRDEGVIRQMSTDYRQSTFDYLGILSNTMGSEGQWANSLALGLQVITIDNDQLWGVGIGLATNAANAVSAAAQKEGGQFFEQERSIGYMGQWQIGYRDRMFLQFGLRVDRNSSFGEEINSVALPKAGFSWVISDEPFWSEGVSWINLLRLRTAYGVTGRAPRPGASIRTYRPSPYVKQAGGLGVGMVLQNPGNPGLKPETGSEFEAGIDAAFFDDVVGLEFTYFDKVTKDLLISRELPVSVGFFGDPWANLGKVINRGIELAVSARLITRPDLLWDVQIQGSTLHNELTDLGDLPPGGLKVGDPLFSYYTRRIREVDVANGVAILSDTLEFLGRRQPSHLGNVSTNVTLWRNLRLYALFDWKSNFVTPNSTANSRERSVGNARERVDPGFLSPEERLRRFGPYMSESGEQLSSRATNEPYLQDASFVRFREFSLTYTVPDSWAAQIGADRAFITLAGRNLYVWTGWEGPDPEAISAGTWYDPFQQNEWFNIPPARRWEVKSNIAF